MKTHLEEGSASIVYLDYAREHALLLKDNPGSAQLISFCPWCGAKLPESLREAWADLLDRDGYHNPFFEDKEKLPTEFWSDAWWKARNL